MAILTDVHQDVMNDAPERLKQFLEAAETADVDLVIQLGDFCQPHPRNQPWIDLCHRCPRPKFPVLGTHDMDGGYRRAPTVEFSGMPSRYYT
ncbi:MAG: metallophosphoesterase, partial [Pseudomonadota bacterium]